MMTFGHRDFGCFLGCWLWVCVLKTTHSDVLFWAVGVVLFKTHGDDDDDDDDDDDE